MTVAPWQADWSFVVLSSVIDPGSRLTDPWAGTFVALVDGGVTLKFSGPQPTCLLSKDNFTVM